METAHSASSIRRLCVFCGSSTGIRPVYQEVTKELGSRLANSGITLVYGGACVGLMGVLANSVLEAGGKAIGVMPRSLVEKEVAHASLTQLHIVDSMHQRKALMAELADAFVLLPGGFGSWEEFCEIVTWSMMGFHDKPCAILNVAGYYDSLISLNLHAISEGFIQVQDQGRVIVEDDLQKLLLQLSIAHVAPSARLSIEEL